MLSFPKAIEVLGGEARGDADEHVVEGEAKELRVPTATQKGIKDLKGRKRIGTVSPCSLFPGLPSPLKTLRGGGGGEAEGASIGQREAGVMF